MTQAIIERIKRVSASTQQVEIAVEKSLLAIAPGQFFLVRVTETLDPYLREPWTPVKRDRSTLIIERPVTQNFYPGQIIDLLGPIGKPIPLPDSTRTLLLMAHAAAPTSLLLLAETALAKGIAVTLALTGSALYYPLDALPQEIEIIRGDQDGHLTDPASVLSWADQIVAVAPPPQDVPFYTSLIDLLRQTRIEVPPAYIYGLFQPPMPCGVGACLACLLRVGREEIATCTQGPAFDLLMVLPTPAGQ